MPDWSGEKFNLNNIMEQNYLGNPNLKKANVSQEWTK
jgi:hypothetical protein